MKNVMAAVARMTTAIPAKVIFLKTYFYVKLTIYLQPQLDYKK